MYHACSPSGVPRIVSPRATFYIEVEKLIQNDNVKSDEDFIFQARN
jgi:hypothetical protein